MPARRGAVRSKKPPPPAVSVPRPSDSYVSNPTADQTSAADEIKKAKMHKRFTLEDYERSRVRAGKAPTTPSSPSDGALGGGDVESGKGLGLSLFDERQQALVQERTEAMEIRRKSSIAWLRERKLRKEAILSGLVYILFMSLYFFIILDQARVWSAHQLEFSLRNYITSVTDGKGTTFEEISNDQEMWGWLEHGLVEALFPQQQWYNGDGWTPKENDYIMHYNRLVGGFKIIQRRVEENWAGCSRSDRFQGFYENCWPSYSDGAKDTNPYGPGHDPAKYAWEADAFGGGYHVELTLDRKLAINTIEELKKDRWTDKSTRQLSIEFIIYNGNMHLFTLVNAEIMMAPTGLMTSSYNMETFRVELYRDTADWVRFTCEILFVIFVALSFILEMLELFIPPTELGVRVPLHSHVIAYFSSFWNWMDLTRIIMFSVVIAKYALILEHDEAEGLQLPLPSGTAFAEMDGLALAWREYKRLNGFNVVLCLITVFKFMNKSPRYGVLVRTIGRAAPDLVKFMIMFVLCLASFSIMGILMFGSALEEWSTPWNATQTLFMMITGEVGYEAIMQVDSLGAPIFYFLFLVIVFFLLVNILLAIMMDAYATLREELTKEAEELLLKYDFPIVNELFLQSMSFLAKYVPAWERPVFLRTEDLLERLESNPALIKKCWIDVPPATVNNADPEPEEIVSYETLREFYPEDEANFMMILVGTPIEESSILYMSDPVDRTKDAVKKVIQSNKIRSFVKAARLSAQAEEADGKRLEGEEQVDPAAEESFNGIEEEEGKEAEGKEAGGKEEEGKEAEGKEEEARGEAASGSGSPPSDKAAEPAPQQGDGMTVYYPDALPPAGLNSHALGGGDGGGAPSAAAEPEAVARMERQVAEMRQENIAMRDDLRAAIAALSAAGK